MRRQDEIAELTEEQWQVVEEQTALLEMSIGGMGTLCKTVCEARGGRWDDRGR